MHFADCDGLITVILIYTKPTREKEPPSNSTILFKNTYSVFMVWILTPMDIINKFVKCISGFSFPQKKIKLIPH